MNGVQPGNIDPLTGQPRAPFVPVPAVDPAANPGMIPVGPSVYPSPPQPVNNKFGGFGSSDPTGPAVTPSGQPPAPFPDPRGAADRAAVTPPAPFPDPRGAADRQPALIPSTTTETTRQTTGPDKATVANINAATADANAAAQAGGQAQADLATASAGLERQQSQEAYGRGVNDYFTRAGEMQTQDEIIRETSARLEDAAKFKPDRTQLFQGDTGLLFGISAAVAAMAGGWLMGQGLTGGKNPYLDTVLRMIDDNANDQIAANSQVYQELTRRLGSAEAAKRELKARMAEALNQTIEAKGRFEKADLVQRGAAVAMADVQKEVAKNRLEAAKLTGQTTTKTVQSRTQMVANPAAMPFGIDPSDPKQAARIERVGMLDALVREAESLNKSGELAANTGLIDEAVGGVKRFFRSRDPGQKRVEDFRAALQLINRADWASEPNGAEIQRQLSQIGVPENDAEIPQALARLRTILNAADPGGRLRTVRRQMGDQPAAVETRRIPVVR